jgi:hypothetical protein
MRRAGLLLLSGAVLCAQDPSSAFTPPVLGFIFDPATKRIRSIAGVPGAARVADVPAHLAFDKAVIAPGSAHALAASTGSEGLVLLRSLNGVPFIEAVPGSSPHFDIGAFSPSGKSAALYSRSCNCIQVITGMPAAPVLARFVETTAATALAITDDGSAIAVAQPDRVEVFRDGADSLVVSGVEATALAASPGGLFAIAERDRRAVRLVRGAEVTEVASERDGLANPVGLAFDGEERLLIAANDGTLHAVALDGSARLAIPCGCSIERVERALEKGLFALGGSDPGPFWMLDLSAPEPRVFFVPFDRQEAQQ